MVERVRRCAAVLTLVVSAAPRRAAVGPGPAPDPAGPPGARSGARPAPDPGRRRLHGAPAEPPGPHRCGPGGAGPGPAPPGGGGVPAHGRAAGELHHAVLLRGLDPLGDP